MTPNWGITFGLIVLSLFWLVHGVPVKTKSGKHRKDSQGNFGDLLERRQENMEGGLETKLLNVFGLRELPKHGRKQFETPSFMMELYQSLAEEKNQQARTTATRQIKANTVRSFFDTGRGRKNSFVFDLHGLLPREFVLSAELRLYVQKEKENAKKDTARVNLFQISGSGTRQQSDLLETRTVHITEKGWLVFDVTQTFLSHQKHLAAASLLENTTMHYAIEMVDESDNELRISRRRRRNQDRMPLLILYLNDTAIRKNDILTPAYMDIHGEKLQDGAGEEKEENTSGKRRRRKRSTSSARRSNTRSKKCQLYEFYVDFQKVGWSDWIIAPNGYNANFCNGHCPFPLDPHFNATNHATVQAILNTKDFSLKGQRIPKPCCVPSDFDSIHVLYLDDYNNVVLKEFDDMEAKSCGCH
ncbi:anti-dorsalizing morphogenic protein 2 precursor [Saccoglossus kowalevskii]|uniref:ADMP2 n=1 Tax=Saccoglossus kowalevskii TaxID=10224 RepID=D1LWV6_SACKO|nr:anti-dorsalizing morphogenic protein 2 precursor [Saccoglossus kowalevskii]ACY92462.1 ADMP2 [Saccoglossus kowalevskii]